MKIGFIGLGIMGSRMAANLLNAGHEITVHNRTQAKAAELIASGATWANTPAEAAKGAQVVITMLAHPQATEQTALHDDNAFLAAMTPGCIWVDSTTANPMFARRMAAIATKHEVKFLDAPVAGSKNQAQDAQLLFIVGGDTDVVATCQPLFEAMGRQVNHVGGHGMGNALKLVVNHMLATSMLAFAEGMALGESLGISQESLLNTLVGGPVTAPFVAGKRAKIETGDYTPEFPLQWMQKDLQMASETAFETGVAMPISNAAKEIYQLASRSGLAEQDFSAIYAFLKGQSA